MWVVGEGRNTDDQVCLRRMLIYRTDLVPRGFKEKRTLEDEGIRRVDGHSYTRHNLGRCNISKS